MVVGVDQNASLIRLAKAMGYGVLVTLALVYLMSQLITGGGQLTKTLDDDSLIEFVRVKRNTMVEERKRKLPKKPPEPQKPPPPQQLAVAADAPSKPQLKMDMPKLNTALKGSGPYLGPAGAGGGRGSTPIVRIEPQYPRKAAMQGLEGWVMLQFDITETGSVSNVKILNSQPKRIFNMAAKRALLKWKYKPAMDEGKPVAVKGEKVQLDFKLEN